MTRQIQLLLLTVILSASVCHGQGESFVQFIDRLPANHTEIFAINRLADQVEGVMENDALRAAFAKSNMVPADAFDEGLLWLDDNRQWFPATVVIAGETKMYGSVTDLFRIIVDMYLFVQGSFDNPEKFRKDLNKLAAELVETADGFRIPEISVYSDWQDVAETDFLFNTLKENVGPIEFFTQLKVSTGQNKISIEGKMQDALPRAQMEAIFSSFLDEEIPGLIDKLTEIPIYVQIDKIENGIRLFIGSAENKSGSLQKAALEHFEAGENVIAYSNWNTKQFKKDAMTLITNMKSWQKTELGQLAAEEDLEDFMGSMMRSLSQLETTADRGQLIVKKSKGRVFGKLFSVGVKPAVDLPGTRAFDKIPVDVEGYFATSQNSFADIMLWIQEDFESRMASQSLKSELQNEQSKAFLLERLTDNYYTYFANYRNHAIESYPKFSRPPFVGLVRSKGSLQSMKIESLSQDFPFEADLSVESFPETIWIASASEPDMLKKDIEKAIEDFVSGFLKATETSSTDKLNLFKPLKLNDSVNATSLDLGFLEDLELAAVQVEGDFAFHIFTIDNLVFLSSSPKFSRDLLASNSSLKISGEGRLVHTGRISGKVIGSVYGTILEMLSQVMSQGGAQQDVFSELVSIFQDVPSVMKDFHWESFQSGENQTTDFEANFLIK